MIHAVKEWPVHFNDVISGRKTFEVRKNDRNYAVGDLIALNEYDTEKERYTGNSCLCYIDYILNDNAYCKEGYIIMSIKPCEVCRYENPGKVYSKIVDYTVPYATRRDNNAE